VWIHYAPHWRLTSNPDFKLGTFCTIPAVRHAPSNLVSEIIGTFVLVVVVAAIFSTRVAASGPAAGLGPYLVGSLVWGIGLSLGGTTGYAINPARDIGPRLAHAILPIPGKRDSDWSYAPIPVVGPLVGGALAGALIKFVGI
jgi:glycerol uptake facilitator protein